MNIKSKISVGNNVTLGFDSVDVETNCHGFITLRIPQKDASVMELELSRQELREYLARTCPAFITSERYEAKLKPDTL